MKQAFREKAGLSKKNLEWLSIVNKILHKFALQGYTLTLRQLYYQLVGQDLIPNVRAEYQKLSTLLVKGRMAGLVDWQYIEDRLRRPMIPQAYKSVSSALMRLYDYYRANRQEGQNTYIEAWCFPSGTPVITPEGICSIEMLQAGEMIIGSKGVCEEVVNTFERSYHGNVIRLKTRGLLPILCTPEHPLLALIYDDIKPGCKGRIRHYSGFHFVRVADLKKFDCLVVPLLKDTRDVDFVDMIPHRKKRGRAPKPLHNIPCDLDFCAVIGSYLAEGNIRPDNRSVQFTFNKNKVHIVQATMKWLQKIGLNPWSRPGKGTQVVYVASLALASWMKNNFGNGARNKRLPYWVLKLPHQKQLAILQAYFQGDGCVDLSVRALRITTRSRTLAMQVQLVLLRNRIAVSVHSSLLTGEPFYRMTIAGESAKKLASIWGVEIPKKQRCYDVIRFDDDFAYFPIRSAIKEKFKGKVYNIETADTNTYCVPCVVHNCEKDALSDILYQITYKYHIRLMVNRGYTSCSALKEAYERFISAQADFNQHICILYIGDHDPSGLSMIQDIKMRLLEFGADVEIEHVALTYDQIEKYSPPPNFVKAKDPRSAGYRERFGDDSWEVDALEPKVLHDLVETAIKERVDMALFNETLKKEKKQKERLRKLYTAEYEREEE